jgi:hypothetical protein
MSDELERKDFGVAGEMLPTPEPVTTPPIERARFSAPDWREEAGEQHRREGGRRGRGRATAPSRDQSGRTGRRRKFELRRFRSPAAIMIHATSSASCLVKDLTWDAHDSEMEVGER